MIQRAGGNRFLRKSALSIRIECRVVVKNLDRDETLEARVAGAIHLSHAAGAKRTDNLIRPELRRRLRHPALVN